jgi:hypothetical protein
MTGPSLFSDLDAVAHLLEQAKSLAKRYRALTGRPLGITGEVGEYEAARLLGLRLAEVRQAGYDAVATTPSGERRYQIKTRCVPEGAKPGQRLGKIDLSKEWDAVLLVLLDADLEPTAIFEAERAAVEAALRAPGSKSRNERGALGVSKFKTLGRCLWNGQVTGPGDPHA